jgi:ABC-2 type transport system permease protein
VNRVLTIAKHELSVTLRRKTWLFMAFVFPVIMVGFAAVIGVLTARGIEQSADIGSAGIVDVANLLPKLPETDFQAKRYASEEAAKEALLADVIEEYFVVPPDYLASGVIRRYSTRRSISAAEVFEEGFLRDLAYENLIPSDVSPQVANRLRSPVNVVSFRLDASGEGKEPINEAAEFLVPLFFAFLLMMSIFTSSGLMLQGVAEEKESRIIEVLISTVSPRQLLMGKVAGLGLAGMIQIGIWLAAARVALGIGAVNIEFLAEITFPMDTVVTSLLYFLLGYLFFAIVMAGFGAVATTVREGQQIGGIFTFAAVIPFMLSSVLLESPDGPLAVTLTYIPFTAPIAAMIRFASGEVSTVQVVISLSILALSTAAALWASAKIFRAYLLMYGRRPRLREVLASLRAA